MKQSLGVGTVWLMISVLVSLGSTYFLHIAIARFLGIEWYGTFGVLMSLYLINDALLNVGIPRAVSKFISESPHSVRSIVRVSFRVQLLFSLLFAAAYLIFAESLATWLQDTSLTHYIFFLGIMVVPLSFFSLQLSGYLNGLRLFKEQATIKIAYPLARTLLAFIFMWVGFQLFGVLLGFLIAILFGIGLSYYYLPQKQNDKMGNFSAKTLLAFAFPLMIAVLAMTLLRNVNILFIKSFLVDNALVALYTAAFTLSNLSYLVFTALPLTLTPSISKAISDNNQQLVQKYISSSLRYALLLLFPLSALIAATASTLLPWLYSPAYAAAAPILSILIFASTFLVLFSTLISIITASGKPSVELWLSLLFLGLLVGSNFLLIPRYGLEGAAYAQLLTSAVAMMVAAVYVYNRFTVLIPLHSFFKMGGASVFLYFLASVWHYSGFLLLINYGVLLMLYFVLLYLFGELDSQDWRFIKKLSTKNS